MSTVTPNLKLFKYNTTSDSNIAFNINTALNNNWDIIDEALMNVDALPDQTDKAGYLLTTDGTNASWEETTEVQCVVETYQNGTSWYRVYSDGWCEQGDYLVPSATTTTINLLKEYKNNKYGIYTAATYTSNTTLYAPTVAVTKDANSFSIYVNSTSYRCYWRTAGYIEV